MEKAFDRCSWDYLHQSMAALGFGDSMINWIRTIYNPDSPPLRCVKSGSDRSPFFPILSGVPQGCPCSPVLFLCITEGMSRLMKRDMPGITIGGLRFILSQFADDTVCYVRSYTDLPLMWDCLHKWCNATGMALNRNKTEGVRMGKLTKTPIPTNEHTRGINWVKPGEWITILGVPFGESPRLDDFFEEKYKKCKLLLSHWHAVKGLTTFGRALIVNSLIYSRFRYWAYCMTIPKHVQSWIESDVHAIVWDKNFKPHPDEEGTETRSLPFIKFGAALRPRRLLGLGLLHWPSHVRAIQAQVMLHYLSGTRSSWKLVLDQWYNRTPEGRGVVFSTTPTKGITRPISTRASALPTFFKQALESFRAIPFEKTVDGAFVSADEAKAEPVWCSRLFTLTNRSFYESWRIEASFNRVQDFLTELGTTYTPTHVYNWMRDTFKLDQNGWIRSRFTRTYSIDPAKLAAQWASFISDCPDYIIKAAQGEPSDADESGTVIADKATYSSATHNMMKAMGYVIGKGLGKRLQGILELDEWSMPPPRASKGLGSAKPKRKPTPRTLYCLVDPTGDNHCYGYIKTQVLNGTPSSFFQVAEISPLGKPRVNGERRDLDDVTPVPVVWWRNTVMGPAEVTYPHPQGWQVKTLDTPIQLDHLTVSKLTAIFRRELETEPSCLRAWTTRLSLPDIPWDAIAMRISSPLTTNKDTHSWFKNILHRRMAVRSIRPHESSTKCRLCDSAIETILHFAGCPCLQSTFYTLVELTNSTLGAALIKSHELTILGLIEAPNQPLRTLPPALYSLFLILWKFVILSLTELSTEGFPYNESKVWRLTISRFIERSSALAHSFQLRCLAALGRGEPEPDPRRFNLALHPLAQISSRSLSLHPSLKSLAVAHSCTLPAPPDDAPPPSTTPPLSTAPPKPVPFVPGVGSGGSHARPPGAGRGGPRPHN